MTTGIGVHPEQLEATPGAAASVVVTVANDLDEPTQFQVRVVGSDTDWSGAPMLTPVVEPGGRTSVEIVVELPLGFPSGHHLLGIEVVPFVNGAASTDQRLRRVADLVVSVGALSGLHAVLEPRTVYGRRAAHTGPRTLKTIFHRLRFSGGKRGQANISLRNRSYEPMHVTLSASSPGDEVSVRFDRDEVVVPPGHIVGVSAKVRAPRPFFGYPRRTPFTVQAQGRGSTVYLEGSYSRTAHIRPGTIKGIGVLTVLALWASSLAVIYERVTADDEPEQATAQQASETGEDGDGGGGNGDGSGSSGQGSGEGGIQDLSVVPASVEASGQVTAREPADVRVRVRSVSLVDDISPNAIFQTGPLGSTSRGSKLFGRRISMVHNRIVPIELATTTDEEGRWAVGGLEGPGFFEIRFSKPGYATRAYVVEVPEDGSPIVLDTDLEAGDGAISGVVLGPDGPMGGVDITVTDGTVTFTTRTPTTGNVGQWSVEGLTTPGSYLITASRRGFGTATSLVRLAGGESARGVQIQMQAGTGSILGTVRSSEGLLGDITITATDGEVTRTATSLTEGPIGSFILPDLPSPGVYTLTIEGEGYLSQTRDVALSGGEARVDISMTPRTATVYGQVTDLAGQSLAAVGINATSEDHDYKSTTNADGRFELVGLEPGSYVIEFVDFEHHTGSSLITVGPGALREVNISLVPRENLEPEPNNTLTFSFSAPGNITVTERTTGATASTGGGASASFTNLPAGMRTFDISGEGFQPATVQFRMGLNGPFSTSVTLRPLVLVDLTVRQRVFQQAPLPGADVVIRRDDPGNCPPTNTSEGCQPFVGTSDANGTVVDVDGARPSLTDGAWIAITSLHGYVDSEHRFITSYDTSPSTTSIIELDRWGAVEILVVEPVLDPADPSDIDGITFPRLHGVTITVVGGPQDGRTFGPLDDSGATWRTPYLLTDLEPGPYQFRLEYPDYRTITIPASPRTIVPNDDLVGDQGYSAVMVPVPDATHGRVVWDANRRAGSPPDYRPIPNATVRIEGIGSFTPGVVPGEADPEFQVWPPVTTDANGLFGFEGDDGPIFGEATIQISGVGGSNDYAPNAFVVPRTFANLPANTDVGDLVLEPKNGDLRVPIILDHGEAPPDEDPPSLVRLEMLEGPDGAPLGAGTHTTQVTNGTTIIEFHYAGLPAGNYRFRASYMPGPDDFGSFTDVEFDAFVMPLQLSVAPAQTLVAKGRIQGTVQQLAPGIDPADAIDTDYSVVAGATVTLLDDDGNEVAEETVGADGVFTFFDLDVGEYTLDIDVAGFTDDLVDQWREPIAVGVGQVVDVNPRFRPFAGITFTVEGLLFPATGLTEPLEDDAVQVTVSQGGDTFVAEWDDDEEQFVVTGLDASARRGAVEITLSADGYRERTYRLSDEDDPAPDEAGLNWGEQRPLEPIVLDQLPGTLVLELTSSTATVDLSDDAYELQIELYRTADNTHVNRQFAHDPETGTWTMDQLPPGDYYLKLNAHNHAPLVVPGETDTWITIQGGETTTEEIELVNKLSSIVGSVSLLAGTVELDTVSDVTVALLDEDGDPVLDGNGNAISVEIDESSTGDFSISDVEDGRYKLRIEKPGFETYESVDPFDVDPYLENLENGVRRVVNVGTIELEVLPRDLSITILSAVDDAPIVGTSVKLEADSTVDGNTAADHTTNDVTDDEGVIEFDAVIPGHYNVVVEAHDGHLGQTFSWELEIGDEDDIDLAPTFTIDEALIEGTVEIFGSGDQDLGNVRVDIVAPGADGPGVTVASHTYTPKKPPRKEEAFELYVPPAAQYRVVVVGPTDNYFGDEVAVTDVDAGDTFDLSADGELQRDLQVVEGATGTVTVTDENTGAVIKGAVIRYVDPRTSSQVELSDTAPVDGVIELPLLYPGSYTFTLVAGTGYASVNSGTINVASGDELDVRLEADGRGRIRFTISSPGVTGTYLVTLTPGANGEASSQHTLGGNSSAGANTLTNVRTGTYTVTVCRPATSCTHFSDEVEVEVELGATATPDTITLSLPPDPDEEDEEDDEEDEEDDEEDEEDDEEDEEDDGDDG